MHIRQPAQLSKEAVYGFFMRPAFMSERASEQREEKHNKLINSV